MHSKVCDQMDTQGKYEDTQQETKSKSTLLDRNKFTATENYKLFIMPDTTLIFYGPLEFAVVIVNLFLNLLGYGN